VPRLSKEHLLSKPVAGAFGIDRSMSLAQFGTNRDEPVLVRLEDASVRLVCERCNNTWMNALEHRMAEVAAWTSRPNRGLPVPGFETMRAWALKTYLVLSVMVGEARRFSDRPESPGVIPNFTRARQLYEDDPAAFDGMAFGLARLDTEAGRFAYAFGNPTVEPNGTRYAGQKSAGLSIVTLGSLQIWAVDPLFFHEAEIQFPKAVTRLEPGVSYGSLRPTPTLPHLEDVIVTNPEHDVAALFDALTEWARDVSPE